MSRHFVEEYELLVQGLLASLPHDAAMAEAVGGGDFDGIGRREADFLEECGLREFDAILDLGCGSGRLAKQLGMRFPRLGYTGTDVVQALLDRAATLSPAGFRFLRHTDLSLPAPDGSLDFVTAFSVFTHLRPEESYVYLRDAKRALKAGGKVVFSFLECPRHWYAFEAAIE